MRERNMVSHMKTTIDIADSLLARAKALAKDEATTLKSLTEEGLQIVLRERSSRKATRIRPVTVSGDGLHADYANANWSKMREAAYGGTGL